MEPAGAAAATVCPAQIGAQQQLQRRLGETHRRGGWRGRAWLGETQCRGGWRGRARCALPLVLFLAVTGSFAGAVYRVRHRPRDLAFVITAYYLIALLLCCVRKLELLRLDPAAGATERRRVRLAVWAVTVALGNTFACRVAEAMPFLALKLVVWGLTMVVLGLALYFIFRCKDEECCNAEYSHGQADAGRRPEKAFHELSPEEKV